MQEYFNTDTQYYFETPPYCDILRAISSGSENARHKSELLRLTGMQDRELRKLIEFLRRKGIVIISDINGYYFPADEAELKAYIAQESSRARSVFYTLRSAKNLLRRLEEAYFGGEK